MARTGDGPRGVTELDQLIGRRLRAARQLKKLSQDQLGALVGVTFQQIQKYERGANRIASSRLWQLSRALDLPITYFYPSDGEEAFDDLLAELDLPVDLDADAARNVLQSLAKANPRVRSRVVELITAIGG